MSGTKKKPKPVKTEAVAPTPQTREEVSAAIAAIGNLQRERTRIQAAMNDEIAAVKARFEAEAEPHNEQIKALTAGVSTWCAANRRSLTDGGKLKTHVFAAGEVRWRITPPKVLVRGTEAVLDGLRRCGALPLYPDQGGDFQGGDSGRAGGGGRSEGHQHRTAGRVRGGAVRNRAGGGAVMRNEQSWRPTVPLIDPAERRLDAGVNWWRVAGAWIVAGSMALTVYGGVLLWRLL